ncbi:MAG TPA: hypothetical protein VF791_15300 [Pyrinomonadaceae bacterium]
MDFKPTTKLRWRLGLAASIAIIFLALFPQLHLWFTRGEQAGGAYAYIDTDEPAYSAYLNALVDNRPRRSDPYTGRDDQAGAKQPESLFSVQFLPPYVIAGVARLFNLKTTTVFIWMLPVVALLTSLAIFWLVGRVTGDDRYAALSVLIVLCLGTLASFQGALAYLVTNGMNYNYLPFLRRYIPALPFHLFFVMCAFVWRLLTSEDDRGRRRAAVGAGVAFVLLVFSYFYLWTTAATWLLCLALLWVVARREEIKRLGKSFAITLALALAALVPYFILLSHRAETMDKVQALVRTHAPDFARAPLWLGILSLVALGIAAWRGRINWRDRQTLFAASFALVPPVVFNQQVITGRSLQPIHYEQFIANYVSLVGVVLTLALLRRGKAEKTRIFSNITLILVALASFGWGWLETKQATDFYYPYNEVRDEAAPVGRRLASLDREAPKEAGGGRAVVFHTNLMHDDDIPTYAPQAVLWAPHMHVFSGVSLKENKERFYQALYYMGVTEQQFGEALSGGDFYAMLAIFGWERTNSALSAKFDPVRGEEIMAEIGYYAEYVASFDRERASNPTLSYVVTETADEGEIRSRLANLDRWYERELVEQVGKFTIYRVRLLPY